MKGALSPITDVLLKDGQLLTVVFDYGDADLQAYSMEIRRSNPIAKKYTELQTLGPDETITADLLGESGHGQQTASPGDSIYKIEADNEPLRVYHLGQAWRPDGVNIFMENPNGDLVQGMYSKTSVEPGDDEGFVPSALTRFKNNFYMPTDILETIILPGVTPFFGFTNDNPSTEVEPQAFLFGKGYEVIPINKCSQEKAKKIALGQGYNRYLKTFGALGTDNPGLPDEWGEPVDIKAGEVISNLTTGGLR